MPVTAKLSGTHVGAGTFSPRPSHRAVLRCFRRRIAVTADDPRRNDRDRYRYDRDDNRERWRNEGGGEGFYSGSAGEARGYGGYGGGGGDVRSGRFSERDRDVASGFGREGEYRGGYG